jgi:hypothetical protein
MTTTMSETSTTTNTGISCGTKVSFDCITQPGCYVNNSTGHLIRVSNDFDPNSYNNWFNCEGNQPWWWTCVSTDPNCSTDECRTNATSCGVDCCF